MIFTKMTSLLNLILLVITIKFQLTQTEFSDKEDYFNHSEDALPEFIVQDALFLTNKPASIFRKPPWITERTPKIKPTTTPKTTTKFTSVAVTFDTKVKWIEPVNMQGIRSNKNNDTNVILPIWSPKSTEPTTKTTTISYFSYLTRTRSKPTTKPIATAPSKTTSSTTTRTTTTTTIPIPNSTTTFRSTPESTAKIFTNRTPIFIFTFSTKNRLPVVPVTPKMISPNLSKLPVTQIANKTNAEAMKTTTRKSTASYTYTTITRPSITTTKPITPMAVTTPRLKPLPYPNRMLPQKHTSIVTYSTVFQDLTWKRNLRGENEENEVNDEANQTDDKHEADHEEGEKKHTTTNLQDKEMIEYRVLETEPFSKFLELLLKQLAVMNRKYAAKFLRTFERQFALLVKIGRFDILGPVTKKYIEDAMNSFRFPTDHKQRLLSMGHNILATRNDTLGPELNAVLDYIDMLYAVKSEVHMERVLNETIAYPNISKTAEEITEGFLEDIFVNPLKRISGTTQGNKLLAAIADIIMNKKPTLNARRIFIGSDYFYNMNKESTNSHSYHRHRIRRPKFVIGKKYRSRLLSDGHGRTQIPPRTEEDTHRYTIYRKNERDFSNLYSEEKNMIRITGKKGKTKIYSLDFVNRAQKIPKYARNASKKVYNVNSNEKIFRASYNSYNNFRQHKMFSNPFRTLLYDKGRNDRFETEYTLKGTPNRAYFQRTRPTTNATERTVVFITSEFKKIENNLNKQIRHESNVYHKQELKYVPEADKNEIEHFVRELITKAPNSSNEDEFDDSRSDEEFTTTTKIRHREKSKVTKAKLSEKTNSTESILKNNSKTLKDTDTTKSEFKEANISLKHFYFKPVIIQNKSGYSNEFVSIEFDGEPNVIDFSMKVKLKKPMTLPTTSKATEKQKNTDTSETPASSTTQALRVFNPYKMDSYFKNISVGRDVKNDKADDNESSSEDSDSSSSSDSGDSELSLKEEKDSQPQVFGKLRKIKNDERKKDNLRSKKHRNSMKRHRKRKHEKHKAKHGKHGKKHNHKFLHTYLKKVNHDRKKRIKQKMKQLKDKRIVGKNFEIAFDASSSDSDGDNLMDVTIVERAKDGKRATISIINKDKTVKASDSSKEDDTDSELAKKKEKSSLPNKDKHKSKQNAKTTTTASTAGATEDYFNMDNMFRNGGRDKEKENEDNGHPETSKAIIDNSHQITNKAKLSENANVEISPPKESRKNKKLSPMLVQINKPDTAKRRDKTKTFEQLQNKVGTAQRRFLPIQVFNDSEYTDEEAELRNNLYDAFRHKDEVYYRRNMRHELPLKDELKEDSDITDEEIILKQNIYKAIKANNRRNYQ